MNEKPIIDGKVFGSWYSTWGVDSKIIGYKKNGKVFLMSIYDDGSRGTEKYIEKSIKGKKALVLATGSDFKEYYVVNDDKNLEYWSPNGNYYTAKSTQ